MKKKQRNGTTMILPEDIPREQIVQMTMKKRVMMENRTRLVQEKRDIGKKIYNLSQEITQLAEKIDDSVLKHFK